MGGVQRVAIIFTLSVLAESSHFRGGIIQWRALDQDGMVEFSHRFAWRHTSCSDADIGNTTLFGGSSITCRSGCSGTVGSAEFYCTDFDAAQDWETGERSQSYSVGNIINFEAASTGGNWITLVVGGTVADWAIKVKGDLSPRPDNGQINSSPITTFAPLRLQAGCTHTIRIPVADPDQDTVRCRWAQGTNECSDVCDSLPGAIINQDSCIITWTVPSSTGSYAVAIQIEDFITPLSITPMSSVPLQFTIEVFTNSEPCTGGIRPTLVSGETPSDGACIAVPIGTTYTAGIVAASGGSTVSITRFITASPFGLETSPVTQSQFISTHYYSNITWTPTASQSAPLNLFCFRALSSNGLETDQSCITLISGASTNLSASLLVQSVSPTGTIAIRPSTTWMITFDHTFTRPSSSRYVRFYETSSGQNIYNFDVTSAAATYPVFGNDSVTLTFNFSTNFIAGLEYYALLDSGVAVNFCVPSLSINDISFWTFSIAPFSVELDFADSVLTELETTRVDCSVSGGSWPFNLTLWRNGHILTQVNGDRITYFTTPWSYGNYTCTVNDGPQNSSTLYEKVQFQLLLDDVTPEECRSVMLVDLKEAILMILMTNCRSCDGLKMDNIVDTRLTCSDSGDYAYFTAALVYSSPDGETTASTLTNVFLIWLLSEDTPALMVGGTRLGLSQRCHTQRNAMAEEACRNTMSKLAMTSANSTLSTPALAAVCFIVGLIAGIVLVIMVTSLIFCMRRNRTASHTKGVTEESEMTMNRSTDMTVNEAYRMVNPRYLSGPPGMDDSVIYEEPTM